MKAEFAKHKFTTIINKNYKLNTLGRCICLMGSRKGLFMLYMGMCLASCICGVVVGPLMSQRLINAIELSRASLLQDAILLMLISTVLLWVVMPVASYVCAWASKQAMYSIRVQVASHMLKLPCSFHDKTTTGDMLSLLSNDIACLEGIYDYYLYKTMENFCVGLTGLVMLFVIDWRLAIAAAILGFGSTFVANRYNEPLGRIGEALQARAGKATTVFLDILKGIRTIMNFGLAQTMQARMDGTAGDEAKIKTELANKQAAMNLVVGILNGLSLFGIIAAGAYMVLNGLTNWGTVIAVSNLQFATGDLFALFPMNVANMQASLAGVERVLRFLDQQEEAIDNSKYELTANTDEASLSLCGVSFAHNDAEHVINNATASFRTGELTAISGASGCGKSTLLKLIAGVYNPTGGIIRINGTKAALTLQALRRIIAYVPQESMLFAATIFENIACGSEYADIYNVMAAAHDAGIDDYIESLPNGYQTQVEENGGSLSGGQRQRIAIARALIKKADILLLDEITASLDSENEAKIMQTITTLAESHTVLMVTHRETTADYASRKLTLNSGMLS